MTTGSRSLPGGVAILATIVIIAGFAYAYLIAGRNRLRFPYATGALSGDAYAALAARPGWKAWRVTLPDGVVLNGLVRPARSAGAPWVLFLPGNDPAQLASGQEVVDRIIATEDWGGAVIAYRGFDGSAGEPHVEVLRTDGVAVHDALVASERLAPSQVHLTAFSIGGHIATSVAGALAKRGAPAPSLSLLASVHDIAMVRQGPFMRLARGDAFQTAPFLRDVPAPVLVLQGANDEALEGPVQGRAIATALGQRATYVELPGVGHAALLSDSSALARVHAFIAQHRVTPR